MEVNGGAEGPAPALAVVYALHDFAAENPDELSFKAGETIEVVERDDQYGDGWWQGRNHAGEYGLFPQSYTTPTAPPKPDSAPSPPSPSSDKGGASASAPAPADMGALVSSAAPDPASAEAAPPSTDSRESRASGMHDTLSEVQHAIDQMDQRGRLSPSPDATPSGSPVNGTRRRAQTVGSLDSLPESSEDDEGEGRWGQNAEEASATRARLAEKAKAQNLARTASAPAKGSAAEEENEGRPAEIELSDESEPGEDASPVASAPAVNGYDAPASPTEPPASTPRPAQQESGIFPSTSDADDSSNAASGPRSLPDVIAAPIAGLGSAVAGLASRAFLSPSAHPDEQQQQQRRGRLNSIGERSTSDGASEYERDIGAFDDTEDDRPFAAAAKVFGVRSSPTIPTTAPAPAPAPVTGEPGKKDAEREDTRTAEQMPFIVDREWEAGRGGRGTLAASPAPSPRESAPPASPAQSTGTHLPSSTAAVGAGVATAAYQNHRRTASAISGASSTAATQPRFSAAPRESSSRASSVLHQSQSGATVSTSPSTPHHDDLTLGADPNEWTVEQVIEWGRGKHLDEFTLAKFAEHEITGDVLLELDLNTLKEIDLTAFGRRVRVHKAITELKKSVAGGAGAGVGAGVQTPVSPASITTGTGPAYTPTSAQFAAYAPSDAASASPQVARTEAGMLGTPGINLPMTPESPPAVGDQYSPAFAQSLGMPSPTIHSPEDAVKTTTTVPLSAKAVELRGLGLTSEAPAAGGVETQAPVPVPVPEGARSVEMVLRRTKDSVDSYKSASPDAVAFPDAGVGNKASPSSPVANAQRSATVKSGRSDHSAPASPETAKTESIRSKGQRTSFLGSLRNRKPPPRVPAPGIGEHEVETKSSPTEGSASPMMSRSATGHAAHRLSTRIFPFAHHGVSEQGSMRSSTSSGRPKLKPLISAPVAVDDAGALQKPPPGPGTASTPSSSAANSPVLNRMSPRTGAKPPPKSQPMPGLADGRRVPARTKTAAEMIGAPDHSGWMRKKGDQYPSWKMRYFVLKGTNLYYLKSETETKIKGHIKLPGYRVIMHGDVNPGRYGFKIVHDTHGSHSFSSEDSKVIREWAKAIMKAIIERDWKVPVVTTCSVEVMDITEAQQMFPPPRPPSPTSRSRMSKGRPAELSEQDAQKLMGIAPTMSTAVSAPTAPPPKSSNRRPIGPALAVNETPGRKSSLSTIAGSPEAEQPPTMGIGVLNGIGSPVIAQDGANATPSTPRDGFTASASGPHAELLEWVNANLPPGCGPATDLEHSFSDGRLVTRLTENLSGASSNLDDAAFDAFSPQEPLRNIETHFEVFDYLNARSIPLHVCSLNELIRGQPDRIRALIEAIRDQFA